MIPSSLKERMRIIWAITKKDLKIAFRFPKNFIAVRLIEPLRLFVLFGLVYQSFFVMTNNRALGNWNRGNYVSILLIGAIFYTTFSYAYLRFRGSFLNEKYWRTIQIFLTAPVSKLDFLIASSLAIVVELSIPIFCYLTYLEIIHPVPLSSLLLILGSLYLMLFGVLGLSLMQGAFAISNENYLFIFDYFYAAWLFFSCFYYTEGVLPVPLRFLTRFNPIYHALEISRSTIFHHLSFIQTIGSAGYVLLFSVTAPYLGAVFFRKVVRELGVRGF